MIKFFKLLANLKYIWSFWNLRFFVAFSFLLQCILIIGSSLRVQTSIRWVHRLIWLVYLLADWAAYYAIGLVVPINRLKDQFDTYDIHSFWAPFLLLHIGGPNTIAGFSLEDNELWDRSILHILVQAGATGISIYRSLSKKRLLAPTLLVLVAAVTRYSGRILALNKGSMDVLKEEILNKGSMGQEIVAPKTRNNDNDGDDDVDDSFAIPMRRYDSIRMRWVSPVTLADHSYHLFKNYKGIFCGLPIETIREVLNDRDELFSRKPSQAFIEMEMELGLAYDLFYTKIWTIVEDQWGKILHYVSLASEVGALVLWALANKDGYHKVDIKLTNALLIGGLFLDVVSTVKLAFSDLAICHLIQWKFNSPRFLRAMNELLSIRNRATSFVLFRRWSGTIKQFDLMNCREPRCCGPKVQRLFVLEHGVKRVDLSQDVKNRIFMGIRDRGLHCQGIKEQNTKLSIEIGEYALDRYDQNEPIGNAIQLVCKRFGVVYALIIWYTTTNLYFSNKENVESPFRKCNQQISEYMMYLLFHRPQMILEGVQLHMTVDEMLQRLKVFVRELNKQKKDHKSDPNSSTPEGENDQLNLEEIMKTEEARVLDEQKKNLEEIMKNCDNAEAASMDVIKDLAAYIEGKLAKLFYSEEVMNDIWFDFLLCVAIRCRVRLHVQELGNGGELLTLVWLMMTHLRLTIEVPRNH